MAEETLPPFRPPAVPLVASDPYLSIWSMATKLTDDETRHWTFAEQPLTCLVRIDGTTYRLMGKHPDSVAAFPQVGVQVKPTRSIYDFDDGHVHITLTFMTPALPAQLEILSRPVTYLTWDVHSIDGQSHAVSIYDATSTVLAVNNPAQPVTWERGTAGSLTTLKCGAVNQALLEPRGDGVRIDWGYAYAAAPTTDAKVCIGEPNTMQKSFADNNALPEKDDVPPRADHPDAMAFLFDLGTVGTLPVSRHLLIAYDEIDAIRLSGQSLPPYWKRNGATAEDLLQNAEKDYPSLITPCENFDRDLMADMTTGGGPEYAQIGALAYRQVLAATGLAADANKQPLLFTKENTSNGDIATVDVFFPTSPMFLFLSPTLAKASIVPALQYAASDRWKFPNAPHDLGTYPVASVTGDAGEAMPVEESGNMLIMCDAIAKVDGNADFVAPWWPQLTQWAQYLEKYGLDPEDQLCTDDFMGHLAHNSNLSIKAILALASYGDLCERRGDAVTAKKYLAMAHVDAQHWVRAADDGDHSRIAFDKPGTWSMKYNLVWDKVLGLDIFPPEVARKEIAYYKSKLNIFGVPLDSRTKLGDTDHMFFCATMADDNTDFQAMVLPFYNYLGQTTRRWPLVDTYQTNDANSDGFHARSVVGGVFIKMLTDAAIWKKWANADAMKPGPWAPLAPLPKLTIAVPVDSKAPFVWRYTKEKPSADWTSPAFDDSAWEKPASDVGKPNLDPKNPKRDIEVNVWRRMKLTLPAQLPPNLQWIIDGRSTGDIYVNGIWAATISGHLDREPQDIAPAALALLRPGAEVVLAIEAKGRNDAMTHIALGSATLP